MYVHLYLRKRIPLDNSVYLMCILKYRTTILLKEISRALYYCSQSLCVTIVSRVSLVYNIM